MDTNKQILGGRSSVWQRSGEVYRGSRARTGSEGAKLIRLDLILSCNDQISFEDLKWRSH